MNTTTPTMTQTKDNDPVVIPHLSTPIVELLATDEIFLNAGEALKWFSDYGSIVLKSEAHELVHNLLTSSEDERRKRGLGILERAIRAQAVWLALIDVNVPFKVRKSVTDALRDADVPEEARREAADNSLKLLTEYSERQARQLPAIATIRDFLAKSDEIPFFTDGDLYDWQQDAVKLVRADKGASVHPNSLEATAKKLRALYDNWQVKQGFISQILQLASEEVFITSARHRLHDWKVRVLDAVLEGHGTAMSPKALQETAERLQFLSDDFFGESSTPSKGAGKGRGRSAKKTAKSAHDKAVRAEMKGRQREKPQHGRGS